MGNTRIDAPCCCGRYWHSHRGGLSVKNSDGNGSYRLNMTLGICESAFERVRANSYLKSPGLYYRGGGSVGGTRSDRSGEKPNAAEAIFASSWFGWEEEFQTSTLQRAIGQARSLLKNCRNFSIVVSAPVSCRSKVSVDIAADTSRRSA